MTPTPWVDSAELVLPLAGFGCSGHYDYHLVQPPLGTVPKRLLVFMNWLGECALQSSPQDENEEVR
jgi:LysR family D-serine deaminase transcriptional activator